MMTSRLVLLALVVLLPFAQAVDVSCKSFGSLKISVVGLGKCTGSVGADCTAVASAQSDIQEAYGIWWGEEGICDEVKLEAAAQAIAHACAAVYVSTLAAVECRGQTTFACGYSVSQGDAFASAMAKAIAQAAVDTGGPNAEAFCDADVEAITGAIAKAAGEAQSQACVVGTGSEEDYSSAFVQSVSEAVASALATASASTCNPEGAAQTSTLCTGEAEATQKGETAKEVAGTASAEASEGVILQCDPSMSECCDPGYASIKCTACKSGGCSGLALYKEETPIVRTWKDRRSGFVCQCPLPHV